MSSTWRGSSEVNERSLAAGDLQVALLVTVILHSPLICCVFCSFLLGWILGGSGMWREILYEAFEFSVQYLERTNESLIMNFNAFYSLYKSYCWQGLTLFASFSNKSKDIDCSLRFIRYIERDRVPLRRDT